MASNITKLGDMAASERKVFLRRERLGAESRYLWAYLDDLGNLHIDGQDLGPATSPVSSDGEHEWFLTIHATELPRLRELLGVSPDADLLDTLESQWSGPRSGELERALDESGIPLDRFVV